MDISKADKNFAINNYIDKEGIRFYSIPSKPFDLRGVFYEKKTCRFVRMPSDVADKVTKGVSYLNSNTAGGRLRFSTDSNIIVIDVEYESFNEFPHMPLSGVAGFTLLEELADGTFKHVFTFMPQHSVFCEEYKKGYKQSCNIVGGKMKNYILFFPLYNDVKSLKIGLKDVANVNEGKAYKKFKPFLYYGSSITQGGCSSRSDTCYQALIFKKSNIDYINLGFSGNARAENEMCDYISEIDCSAFICDYDHNATTVEYLNETHYHLYETFRKTHKLTPVILISRPDTEHDTQIKQRYNIIKATYDRAKKEGDKNIYLINGGDFFKKDRDACTVDGTHPNDLGFYKMAQKIYSVLKKII